MIRRFLCTAVAALVALAGCVDGDVSPVEPITPSRALSTSSIELSGVLEFAELPDLSSSRHAEKFILADEGGFVELNGFRVDIPAGALPHDATITIDLPEDAVLGKRLVAEFGPHGIQFNEPVTLTFPLEGVILSGNPIEVARWENEGWTSLGGTVSTDGLWLSGTTPHFSAYAGKDVMAGG